MDGAVVNSWQNPYGLKKVRPVASVAVAEPGWRRAAASLGRALEPLLEVWIRIGAVLGRVMTFVLLTVIYFAVIGPLHVYLRLTGARLLELTPDPTRPSYWSPPRSANRPERDRKQF